MLVVVEIEGALDVPKVHVMDVAHFGQCQCHAGEHVRVSWELLQLEVEAA